MDELHDRKTFPHQSSKIILWGFWLFVIAVYYYTTCPGIRFWDTAELTASSYFLGIAHAPGFPLYTIIGRLAVILCPSDPAFAVSLLSAFFGSAAVLLFILLYDYLDESHRLPGKFFAAALFAFGGTLWMQSNRAEVYSLQIFLTELSLLLLLKHEREPDSRFIIASFYIWGLSTANHTASALAVLPVLLLILFSGRHGRSFPVRKSILVPFGIITALSVYLYLPIRSGLNPPVNWGRINDLNSFLSLITAREFAFTAGFDGWLDFSGRLLQHWKILYANFPTIFPLLTIIGMWQLRNKLYLLILFLTGSAITLIRQELPFPDHLGYLLPVILVCAVWTGTGINRLFDLIYNFNNSYLKNSVFIVVIIAIFLTLITGFPRNFRENNLHNNTWAAKLGTAILDEPPQDSIVLFNDVSSYFICRYLQDVDSLRQDCSLILPGMLNDHSSSKNWYRAELLSRTNLECITKYTGSTTTVIARIIENNKQRPIYLEYGEQFLPFHNYLVPSGLLFKLDLTGSDSTASFYLFPGPEQFGSDHIAAAAFAERIFALGQYYSGRGEFAVADSLFAEAGNYELISE